MCRLAALAVQELGAPNSEPQALKSLDVSLCSRGCQSGLKLTQKESELVTEAYLFVQVVVRAAREFGTLGERGSGARGSHSGELGPGSGELGPGSGEPEADYWFGGDWAQHLAVDC